MRSKKSAVRSAKERTEQTFSACHRETIWSQNRLPLPLASPKLKPIGLVLHHCPDAHGLIIMQEVVGRTVRDSE